MAKKTVENVVVPKAEYEAAMARLQTLEAREAARKAKNVEKRQSPEYKERQRAKRQTEEFKAKQKERNARPEVAEKRKAAAKLRKERDRALLARAKELGLDKEPAPQA